MTEEAPAAPGRSKFPFLPCLVFGISLALFLLTLNHWLAFAGLDLFAQSAGWDWRPALNAPLTWLVTLPVRYLPAGVRFIAFNGLSALLASLSLALLARSITLLPHDRTRDQRNREVSPHALLSGPLAWLPAVAAAALCGFQMSFWENATNGTGEMLDLLLFAYPIRCLLEYRLTERPAWLARMAVTLGLGMANNWAMLGFFPFFVIALLWITGRGFFNFRFLLRLVGFGLAGFSIYLIQPAVVAVSGQASFSEGLHALLATQKFALKFVPRWLALVLALPTIFPLLIAAIRWPSSQGDISGVGNKLTDFAFHILHLFLFLLAGAVFFDLKFSPRTLEPRVNFLTFYYAGALSVGYFGGYLLLIFGRPAVQNWLRPGPVAKIATRILFLLSVAALVAAPVVLGIRNFPKLRATNGPALRQFASALAQSLPERNAVILSDDLPKIYLLQAAWISSPQSTGNLIIDTSSFLLPHYHVHLLKGHPDFQEYFGGASAATQKVLNPGNLVQLLQVIEHKHPVYYLHPSFGYYFEYFYPVPHGLVEQLLPYPNRVIEAPRLAPEIIAENESFWTALKPTLDALPALTAHSSQAALAGSYYARSLNNWGVFLQRNQRLPEAGQKFATAAALNPYNVIAQINQQYNALLRAGRTAGTPSSELLQKLGQFRSWDNALRFDGPVDELSADFQLGGIFSAGNNARQGAQYFLRVIELDPANFSAHRSLAYSLVRAGYPDRALQLVAQMRADPAHFGLGADGRLELLRIEADALAAQNHFPEAEKLLLAEESRNPPDEKPHLLVAQFYLDHLRYTNALAAVDRALSVNPTNRQALLNESFLKIQMRDFAGAILPLNRLVQLNPEDPGALMNRAIAQLQANNLDAARRDYELLEKLTDTLYQVHYGLGEIAYRQKDKKAALKYYGLYLKYAPTETQEYQQIAHRAEEVRHGVFH